MISKKSSSKGWTESVLTYYGLATSLSVVQALIFALYYPRFYTIYDEGVYLTMSYVFNQGGIYADSFSCLFGAARIGAHSVFKYAPGLPLLLCPFTICSWEASFIANFLLFCAGGFVFAAILQNLRIRAFWVVLYYFFPPFVLYSRTLMSDLGGMVFILASFLFCHRSLQKATPINGLMGGILLGCAISFRWANGLAVPFFVAWLLLKKSFSRQFAAGLTVTLAAVATYWLFAFGGPASSPYLREPVSVSYAPSHLAIYLPILLILYPGMLLSLFFPSRNTPVVFTASLTFAYIGFYSCYHFIQGGTDSWPAALVTASRFIMPVQALLLVHYAGVLDQIYDKLGCSRLAIVTRSVAILIFVAGMIVSREIHRIHADRCNSYRVMADAVRANVLKKGLIISDGEAVKCLNPFWSCSTQSLVGLESLNSSASLAGGFEEAISKIAGQSSEDSIQLITISRPATLLRNAPQGESEWAAEALRVFDSKSDITLRLNVDKYRLDMRTTTANRLAHD